MGSRAVMVRLLFDVRHGRATGSCLICFQALMIIHT